MIGREEEVMVFKPRAVRWKGSVRFGLEDRERDGQQETSSEANGEQKPARKWGTEEGDSASWVVPPSPQTTQ